MLPPLALVSLRAKERERPCRPQPINRSSSLPCHHACANRHAHGCRCIRDTAYPCDSRETRAACSTPHLCQHCTMSASLSQTSETDRPCCWLCRHPAGDHLQAHGQRVVSLQSFRGHFVCIRWPCPGRVVCTHTLACDGRLILATENGMCVTVCAASSHDPPSPRTLLSCSPLHRSSTQSRTFRDRSR
jgi:hypothetical protein